MDAQIENAIQIAWNPASDQNLKGQAFDFINQLRSDPQGWQICLNLFIRTPRASEIVRHVALEVINHAVQARQVGLDGFMLLKDGLLQYARAMYKAADGGVIADNVTIQNKVAQTITYLFTTLYAREWPTFFNDFMDLTRTSNSSVPDNPSGIIFYLRLLVSIHDEIAEVLLPRSSEEQQRDNDLKDLVRERDAKAIASSWQEVLSHWRTRDSRVVEQCLAAIGRWASWTDLSLIVNDTLLSLLFELVGPQNSTVKASEGENLRDVSIVTFTEILAKKMKAEDKLELIDVLRIETVVSQLLTSPALNEMRSTSNYDTDLAEKVAKLVNSTVVDIVAVLDSSSTSEPAFLRADSQLKVFLPHVLRFFSDEYDEICSTVIASLTDILAYFRKKAKFNTDYQMMLRPILQAIVAKMKYDETSSWGAEDAQTDEAEFQDLRKRLRILQQAVAAVDEPLYIDTISTVVGTIFEKFQSQRGQLDWRDVDLAMHEMFLFGELAVKAGGLYSKTKPVSPAAERLINMMFKLAQIDIASFSHPAIQLQYMEICVRYSSFFEANPQFITRALEYFVQFMHHKHPKVKSRSWYLFQRFVKHLRQQMGNLAHTVIQSVSDLLTVKAELPEEDSGNDDMSSDEDEDSADATFNAQLYLYEAIGCICSTRAVPVENQVVYLQSVMNPLFSDLEACLGSAKAGDALATLQVHHLMMALGTLARGFSDWTPANTSSTASPPATAVSEEFAKVAEAILVALESLQNSFEIRTAARFAFSRLIGVLGNRILPQLPRWIDGLLSQTSSKDEIALFLKLLDQVVYGFKTEIFEILNALLSPFLQRVFTGIAEPITGTDDEVQLAELKREYLGFLVVLLGNDLGSVLVSTTNQPLFDTVISTIEHFARDITDFPIAKLAFSVLIKMTQTWGGPDVSSQVSHMSNGVSVHPQPTLPGFDQFIMERFSVLCWAVPTNPEFKPKDAQGRQVLGEAANLQKAIYAKTGAKYLSWLRDAELRGMGMDDATMEEYLGALCNLDGRAFKLFFQNFVQRGDR